MSLQPILSVKVDELYQRWFTDPGTQIVICENLAQLLAGKSLAQLLAVSSVQPVPGPSGFPLGFHNYSNWSACGSSTTNNANLSLNSHGIHHSSRPQTPPHFPAPHCKVASPRSPRHRNQISQIYQQKDKKITALTGKSRKQDREKEKPKNEEDTVLSLDHPSNFISDCNDIPSATNNVIIVTGTVSSKEFRHDNGRVSPRTSSMTLHTVKEDAFHIESGAGAQILPVFYFQHGAPLPSVVEIADSLAHVGLTFDALPNKIISDRNAMATIVSACGLSFYWRHPLWSAAGGRDGKPITKEMFLRMWKNVLQTCGDNAARFVRLMSRGQRNYLVQEDFVSLIQDVVDCHPGLQFLQEAPEFHSRYVHTVVARIFYEVNCSWTWRITAAELRRSNFLDTLLILETEDDINVITDYFSYEHFYVIYCKFWELDQDHDLFINREDLARHNNCTLSERIVERIFSGCVSRGLAQRDGRMPYTDFVWFLLAEEDKQHQRSIEYWFRCMDLDGDGVLSLYELEYFYSEQIRRMEEARIEDYLGLDDCLCAMLDLVKPRHAQQIRLADLKRCRLAHIFLDTMFNLYKFLVNEQKDPFSNLKDSHLSDWEKYANEMYDILVREGENGGDGDGEDNDNEEDFNYLDDFENDDDKSHETSDSHYSIKASEPRSILHPVAKEKQTFLESKKMMADLIS